MELDVGIVFQFLVALLVGGLIGAERGIQNKIDYGENDINSYGETRTFALISFLGALTTFLGGQFQSVFLMGIAFFLLGVFIVIYYIYGVFRKGQYGLTTEIAGLVSFLLGVFVMLGYGYLAIILSIIVTFLLSSKNVIEKIQAKVSPEELGNTIKFAVISLVILPLLPNQKYSIIDIFSYIGMDINVDLSFLTVPFFNPYGIWFFVVLMSGISYIGYIMSKFIGQKGSILASGAIGGLISSTAVTASMTENSRKDTKNTDMYVVSTLLASTIMFVRVVVIVLFFNINLFGEIFIPSLFMLLGMVAYMLVFYIRGRKKKKNIRSVTDDGEKFKSPFSIGPALKFALFVLMIKFISAVGGVYKDIWGDYFFYALGVISGLADVDAISQTMAVDAKAGQVGAGIAVITIIIAIMSNNIVKGLIAFKMGEKKFGVSVLFGFIVSMIMGGIGIFVTHILW